MTLDIGSETLEGKYLIRDIIGKATFGKVYLAHDQPLDSQVAIKELRRAYHSEIQTGGKDG